MSRDLLAELLEGNDEHVASAAAADLAARRDGQRPPVVSVCCSDSRVSQEGMWAVDRPGFLFTAGNIGNRVSDRVDGERVLAGSVAYPLAYTETDALAVVGHTGCGAVGAALSAARTGEFPAEPGVRADVEELVPIVESGLDALERGDAADGAGSDSEDRPSVRNRLVEYNVHEQVAIAREADEAAGAEVYGFVYDFHGAYGGPDGAVSLVNIDGERDLDALRERVGPEHADRVATLL
ncbi:carbonic anhydrase [Halorubrum lipolyticum]|uniref:carbonic anhydrase n=1 Tax=Halorubrum lipolyticum DSM 21995 TaxID=1227482 RepID=M0NIA5_9EURY|nr:carbonic anhydrase [Halorubrum lipolyticum]EMA57298.1 carbonic anhydrase [Halorubrum lipolyticum DSM 21995]